MKKIDLNTWPRKKHFDFFNAMQDPYFATTAEVEVTGMMEWAKKNNHSIFAPSLYLVMSAVNEIKEFKQRVRGGEVIEHEVVHPSFTVLGDDDLFYFTHMDYTPNMEAFFSRIEIAKEKALNHEKLDDEGHSDDLIYISVLPWVKVTEMKHPMPLGTEDSVPRISWSKIFERDGKWFVYINALLHHGLADGLHVSRFYQKVEEIARALNNRY